MGAEQLYFRANMNILQETPIELEYLNDDLVIIQKLDDEPNDVGGLSSWELKERFDKAGLIIKDYLNGKLIPAVLASNATEISREESEEYRATNEQGRVDAEEARIEAENQRSENEDARVDAEASRVSAEERRVSETEGIVARTVNAIENMEAFSHTLEPGSQAEIQKSVVGDVVHLDFGIPKGDPYIHSEEFETLSRQVHSDAEASAKSVIEAAEYADKAEAAAVVAIGNSEIAVRGGEASQEFPRGGGNSVVGFTSYNRNIALDGAWTSETTVTIGYYYETKENGFSIDVQANDENPAYISFLKSLITSKVDSCAGTEAYYMVETGTTVTFTVPDDCKYIFVKKRTRSASTPQSYYTPLNIKIYCQVENIAQRQNKLEKNETDIASTREDVEANKQSFETFKTSTNNKLESITGDIYSIYFGGEKLLIYGETEISKFGKLYRYINNSLNWSASQGSTICAYYLEVHPGMELQISANDDENCYYAFLKSLTFDYVDFAGQPSVNAIVKGTSRGATIPADCRYVYFLRRRDVKPEFYFTPRQIIIHHDFHSLLNTEIDIANVTNDLADFKNEASEMVGAVYEKIDEVKDDLLNGESDLTFVNVNGSDLADNNYCELVRLYIDESTKTWKQGTNATTIFSYAAKTDGIYGITVNAGSAQIAYIAFLRSLPTNAGDAVDLYTDAEHPVTTIYETVAKNKSKYFHIPRGCKYVLIRRRHTTTIYYTPASVTLHTYNGVVQISESVSKFDDSISWVKEIQPLSNGQIHFNVKINDYFADYSDHDESAVHGKSSVIIDPASYVKPASERLINAVLVLPDNYKQFGEPVPLVFLHHGANGDVTPTKWYSTQVSRWTKMYRSFVDRGFAVFDVNGCNTYQDGDFTAHYDCGAPNAVLAAEKAYEYITKNYNVTKEIGVVGCSMGGAIAVSFAMKHKSITKAIGILSGVDIRTMAYHMLDTSTSYSTDIINAMVENFGYSSIEQLRNDNANNLRLASYDIEHYNADGTRYPGIFEGSKDSNGKPYDWTKDGTRKHVVRLPAPFLSIIGSRDGTVNTDYGPAICEASRNAGNIAQHIILSDEPHGISVGDSDLANDLLVSWMERFFNKNDDVVV